MQNNSKPLTAAPMEELGIERQDEIKILNLKNLGYTMVRNAIPEDLLQQVQVAFDAKMNKQIDDLGRQYRNQSNRFDLIPLWQEPVFRKLVNLPKVMPVVRGYMERYWDDEPAIFGAGHGHCLFEHSPAHQAWHNDARVNKKASDMTPPIYIRLTFLIEDVDEEMGPTGLLPGTHGTHVNSPPWFNAPDGQPRSVPDMVLATGKAGDCMINDTSIYHTNTPNLSDRVRKVIWAIYAGTRTPIWERKDLPQDYKDQARLTKSDVGPLDDPVMAALFRNYPEE